MSKYIGVYEISKYLVETLQSSGALQVSIGSRTAYSRDKKVITPGAHISPVGMSINTNRNNGTTTVEIQLEVFVYGLLTFRKIEAEEAVYGTGNEIDVLDECGYIVDRLMRKLGERTIRLENIGYVIAQPGTFQAVIHEGADDLGGLQGVITFTLLGGSPNC
jgi:hypothetical protein